MLGLLWVLFCAVSFQDWNKKNRHRWRFVWLLPGLVTARTRRYSTAVGWNG